MKNQRVDLSKTDPELYRTVYSLERRVSERISAAGIDEGFAHLLRLRDLWWW
jgi:hypothetical protein